MSASDEALKVNIYPTGNAFTRNPIFCLYHPVLWLHTVSG